MRKLILLLIAITCLGMTGCVARNSHMQVISPAQADETVSLDETAIVFFRPASLVGRVVQAPIIEADENGILSFVAVIPAGTKYLHRTSPGKHLYIVGGESSEMLEADMEAGETYYVHVTPFMGVWKARFFLVPVSDVTSDIFKKDLARSRWVRHKPNGSGQRWFEDNIQSLQEKYTYALKKHNDAEQAGKKIILPEYGTTTPVR